MDADLAAECARLGRRQEPLELLSPDPSRESSCDEERDVLVGDAVVLELVENRRERERPRIDLRSRQWECRRLDDDRDVHASARERGERGPGEGIGECVSHRGSHVDHACGRGRWAQDHVVGADGTVTIREPERSGTPATGRGR